MSLNKSRPLGLIGEQGFLIPRKSSVVTRDRSHDCSALGIELRALHMWCFCSTTELQPQQPTFESLRQSPSVVPRLGLRSLCSPSQCWTLGPTQPLEQLGLPACTTRPDRSGSSGLGGGRVWKLGPQTCPPWYPQRLLFRTTLNPLPGEIVDYISETADIGQCSSSSPLSSEFCLGLKGIHPKGMCEGINHLVL